MSMDLGNGFKLTNVKRFKRGAFWGDGNPRMCVRCAVNKRDEVSDQQRGRQAVLTATLTFEGSPFVLPVDYCPDHLPEEISA